jgi:acetoacetyl-CoA reductase
MTSTRTALVTGGLGGIGTGICISLSKAAYRVIAADVAQANEARWLETLQMAGVAATRVTLDVTDIEACQVLAQSLIAEHGAIDIIVNCAGITRDASFRKMSKADWDAVMSTNLDSVFNVTKPLVETMIARGWGRIVNISSVNATRGQFGQTNYSAAKAGLLGFTKSLAYELGKYGITVNAVSPGYIDTAMTQAMRDGVRESTVAMIPAGRPGTPADIAGAVAFLCTDEASYVNGANLAVNGGLFMYQWGASRVREHVCHRAFVGARHASPLQKNFTCRPDTQPY